MPRPLLPIAMPLLVFALAVCTTRPLTAQDGSAHEAVRPEPRQGQSMARHLKMNERVKQGKADLIFIGDSITQGWEGPGKEVWQKHYAKRNAVNLGINGDFTQNVLWRLDNGNLDGIQPRLAIVMIGTNNARAGNTPQQTAEGIIAVVEKVRKKLPETKVLLLGIFPRGAEPGDKLRKANERTNELIKKLANDKKVYFQDISERFLEKDGTISRAIMPDLLHLSRQGYEIWAAAIEANVKKLMGES